MKKKTTNLCFVILESGIVNFSPVSKILIITKMAWTLYIYFYLGWLANITGKFEQNAFVSFRFEVLEKAS